MSFEDFSIYVFPFSRLDEKISDNDLQKKYYDRWMQKYAKNLNVGDASIIEWNLRCHKAMREMFSSADFFVEAKICLENGCYSAYYFALYYSLFHAVYATLFMDTDTSIDSLLKITHTNLVNKFINAYCRGKPHLFNDDINEIVKNYRYRREYFSYCTPFNNIFNFEHDLAEVEQIILDYMQLTSFHSLMLSNSFNNTKLKIVKLNAGANAQYFWELIEKLFTKVNEVGKTVRDSAIDDFISECFRDGCRPEYIALDLDHQFDELHTYDWGHDIKDGGLKAADVYSVVYRAVCG